MNAWFPDGSRFLVNSLSPGALGDIWALSMMDSQPCVLRQHAWGWSVSPDGAFIAFATKTSMAFGDIWVMNANGEQAHQIEEAEPNTEFDSVRWSPDGQRLAYVKIRQSSEKYPVDIEVRELHGGTPRVLLRVDAEFFLPDLEWLSDGQLIFTGRPKKREKTATFGRCDWTSELPDLFRRRSA